MLVIFKGQGRVAFGIEVLKNELFLQIKVLGNYQQKYFNLTINLQKKNHINIFGCLVLKLLEKNFF